MIFYLVPWKIIIVERTSGQRAIGTGPMDRVHKHDRVHVAKVCFITAPSRLLHDEFRDPYGGNWLIFWHQKLFTLTRFVQALRQADFDMVTMLTFSSDSQGLADFQLKTAIWENMFTFPGILFKSKQGPPVTP